MEPQKPCPGCGSLPPGHASACLFAQEILSAKLLAAELVGLMKTLGIAWLVIGSVYVLCGSLCYGTTMTEGAEFADAVQFGSIVTIGIGVLHAIFGGLFWRRELSAIGCSLCGMLLIAILFVPLGLMAPWLVVPLLGVYAILLIVTISAMNKQKTIEGLQGGQEVLSQIAKISKTSPVDSTSPPDERIRPE